MAFLPPDLLNSELRIVRLNVSYNPSLASLRGISRLVHLKILEAEGCKIKNEDLEIEEMTLLVRSATGDDYAWLGLK